MLRYLVLFFLCSASYESFGQNIGLSIGDKLPESLFGKVINSNDVLLNTSEFNDKLLIIDFWATTCSGCVAALPKMDSLQKKYASNIKIVPVTYESSSLVKAFWKKNKYTRGLSLPTVVEDTVFTKYFKHKIIPHEVWINKGKIIAITSEEYVDENNIDLILKGVQITWPTKNDFYIVDKNKMLFDITNNAKYYSIIGSYRERVNSMGLSGGSGIVRDSSTKTYRAFFFNQPIFTSYRHIFMKTINPNSLVKPDPYFSSNEVVWEVSDTSKYLFDKKYGYSQDWLRKFGICYELVGPDKGQKDEEIYNIIFLQLNALLGLNVRWEKRNEYVYVMVKHHSSKAGTNLNKKNGSFYSISSIIHTLNQQSINPYIFNSLNSDDNDVKIFMRVSSWTDIESLRIFLQESGYDLRREKRLVDKLIFSEIQR